MKQFSALDRLFMKRALELAAKAHGMTSSNPMVGAVLVKNGKIIAEGYHHAFGKAHAEVETLKTVPLSKLIGSTLYVTLEPCSHFGKTPPCVDFLIKKGLKKVVVAMMKGKQLVLSESYFEKGYLFQA